MMSADLVRETVRSCFGSALACDNSFTEGILRLLLSFAPYRESFADLSRRMEDHLFNALYDRLGPGMSLRPDDGTPCRLRMADLPAAADRMLYPLFVSLSPISANCSRLRDYWMESGSLSALRALLQAFPVFLSAQETAVMHRILEENAPFGWPPEGGVG